MTEMEDESMSFAKALFEEQQSLTADLEKARTDREDGRRNLQQLQQERAYLKKQKEERQHLCDLQNQMTVLQKQLKAKEKLKQQALQDLAGSQRSLQHLQLEAGLNSLSNFSWNGGNEKDSG
jgi:predicted  nucleic acid-binding Zn-ribbon protein